MTRYRYDRWQRLPALPEADLAALGDRVNRIIEKGGSKVAVDAVSRSYGVVGRTGYRYAQLRRKAAAFDRAWGSLHEIGCPYPTKGCRCCAVLLTLPLRSVA